MTKDDLLKVTEVKNLPSDSHRFADAAFTRAACLIPNEMTEDNIDRFFAFLKAEADETLHEADYLEQWPECYHTNAPLSRRLEAAAYNLMIERFQNLKS